MISELILDRMGGEIYNPLRFYRRVHLHRSAHADAIIAAMDSGVEADAKRALCDYIEADGLWAPSMTEYIRSVEWLTPIVIPGRIGTWHPIGSGDYIKDDQALRLYLMEHDEYGDEAACVIIDEDGTEILDEVYNGFDDLLDAGWEADTWLEEVKTWERGEIAGITIE